MNEPNELKDFWRHTVTISDYRLIKWLTGYTVNSDFEYNQEISEVWYK